MFFSAIRLKMKFPPYIPDCRNFGWVTGGDGVLGANNAHPWVECSNKGLCNRNSGYASIITNS